MRLVAQESCQCNSSFMSGDALALTPKMAFLPLFRLEE
jgi:hypothetical protein